MNISGEDKRDFEARYEVVPFSENKNYTEWKSMTGGPEPLFGLFVVVEDTILTPSQSRSGVYWGQEAHIRVGKGEYSNRGFSFLKDEKVSSWSMRLIKEN
jgi:hypothetical protein